MSQVAAIARIPVAPGKRDELLAVFDDAIATAHDEPATLRYILHEDLTDPDVLWFYEVYADADGKNAHSTSAAMALLRPRLGPLLAGPPEVIPVRPIGGKDALGARR